MTFISITLVNIISDCISSHANQQANEDLGMLMLAILREARLTEIILIRGFKIESGHIVKHHTDLTLKNS